ncbi:hypothetical protein SEA_ARACELI_1 [Streptomyces phage Araceli]|nr:hypothetical protein SEA_ARACELI_1 [Streptomyces phage Araceli]
MAKGDWEVYEDSDREPIETPVHQQTACQLYGHTFETVTDDDGNPLVFGTEFMRRCNDCGDTYTYDPDEDEESTDG